MTLTGAAEPRRTTLVAMGIIAALTVYDQVHLLATTTSTFANEDETTIWASARDWVHFHPRQLNYYGQNYASSLEGLFVAVLHAFGVAFNTATPLFIAACFVLGWFVLGWVAWKRQHPLLALVACAVPALTSAYGLIYAHTNGGYGWAVARFLVVVGAAVLLARPRHPLVIVGAWLALGLALYFDSSTALLSIPVGLWYLLTVGIDRKAVRLLACAAVPVAIIAAWSWWFYRAHPDYNLHGNVSSVSYAPSFGRLRTSLGEPSAFFRLFAPEVWRSWTVPLAVAVVIVAVAILTRFRSITVPTAAAVVLVLWGMSVAKTQDSLGIFIPRARVLTLLPATLWLIAFIVADHHSIRLRRSIDMRIGVAAIVALVVVSVGLRVVSYHNRVHSLHELALTLPHFLQYGFESTDGVHDECAHLHDVATANRAPLVVFLEPDRTAAYGCAALWNNKPATLFPTYERRTWRLYDELHRTRDTMLIVHPPSNLCAFAAPRTGQCAMVDPDVALLSFAPQSPLRVLDALALPVRPFGPHCTPKNARPPTTVLFVCAHPIDISPTPKGELPTDVDAARAAIIRTYTAMLASTDDAPFENGLAGELILAHGATCDPQLRSATLHVDDVQFINPRFARVKFTVSENETQHAFTNDAVLDDGHWRVGQNALLDIIGVMSARREHAQGCPG